MTSLLHCLHFAVRLTVYFFVDSSGVPCSCGRLYTNGASCNCCISITLPGRRTTTKATSWSCWYLIGISRLMPSFSMIIACLQVHSHRSLLNTVTTYIKYKEEREEQRLIEEHLSVEKKSLAFQNTL